MLLVNKNSVDELTLIDSNDVTYMPPPVSEIWKINMVKEITDIKFGVKSLQDYPHDDLDEILNYLCTK